MDYKASDAVSLWEQERNGGEGVLFIWFSSSSFFSSSTFCQGEEEISPQRIASGPKPVSQLDLRVQALVEMICNIRTMEEMVMEMKYDSKKAPLGKGFLLIAIMSEDLGEISPAQLC